MSEVVLLAEAVDGGETLVEDRVVIISWVCHREYQPLAKGDDG